MARIRTIKPEFWTDSDIIKLSIPARLFYIGLWNFADDNGVLDAEPIALKMKIYPNDRVNIEKLLQELATLKKILRYEVNFKPYILIINLKNHQIIDRPRKSILPYPDANQLKSTEINHRKEGKGREGKGKDICHQLKSIEKPTPAQISEYAKSINFDFNGQTFWDYYEARGWKFKTGQPMVSWKATVRTWKNNKKEFTNGNVNKVGSGVTAEPNKYDGIGN